MLNFNWFPQYFQTKMHLTLPLDCKPILENWTHIDALSTTKFVKGAINYLGAEFEKFWVLNYTQDPGETVENVRRRSDVENGRVPNGDIVVTGKDYWVEPRRSWRKRKLEVDEGEEEGIQDVSLKALKQTFSVASWCIPEDSCCRPGADRMGIKFN